MKWMKAGGELRARGIARESAITADAGRRVRQFTWTDSETGDVIRVEVRGTPAYLSDLAMEGFRPSTPSRLSVVLVGVLAIGAGLASWIAGERGDRTGAGSSSIESEKATAKECPMRDDGMRGPGDGPDPSV